MSYWPVIHMKISQNFSLHISANMCTFGPMKCPKCGGTGDIPDYAFLLRKRIKSGISQTKAAKIMGISNTYLSELENGRRDWNARLLAKFKRIL